MKTLYIARHCETIWNAEKRMQGWHDSSPSQAGTLQVEALRQRMHSIDIDAIYSSPTGRALFTAQQVCGMRPLKIITDPRLREIHLGNWEGRLENDLKASDFTRYFNFWNNPAQYETDGGENFSDVALRMKSFLDEIAHIDAAQTIFAVSHTVAIRMLCSVIQNIPVADLWKAPELKPTAITEIRISSGRAEVVKFGDGSHILT